MNDIKSDFANQVRQYILDVLSGKIATEDETLGNFAKSVMKYEEIINNPEGEVKIEELDELEDCLETAANNYNGGFGEIIDKSISQLQDMVKELKKNTKNRK